MKEQAKHPSGHGPQLLVGVRKYAGEHVVQLVGSLQTSHPLGHPTHTPETTFVLLLQVMHVKSSVQTKQFCGHYIHSPVTEESTYPSVHLEHRF